MAVTPDNELKQILSDLVRYETVEQQVDQKHDLITYAHNLLQKSGLDVKVHESGDLPSLYASPKGNKHPRVLLQAHIDVVPANQAQFELSESDGKLHGRGVFDMKFAVACYLYLAKRLQNNIRDYDFGIMLTADEEIGGENGVSAMLSKGYRADICVLPDGGDNWQIEASCNGVWLVKINASGESAHGSRPWEGKNAISSLTDTIHQIREFFPYADMHNNSLTVSQIQGGGALNQVPDQAWATLDMRFINEVEYSKNRVDIESAINKGGLHLETVAHVASCHLDTTIPLVQSFINSAEEVTGKPIGKTHSFGSSDAHYFNARGIPTVLLRPDGGGAHSNKEWIDAAGFATYYDLIESFIHKESRIA